MPLRLSCFLLAISFMYPSASWPMEAEQKAAQKSIGAKKRDVSSDASSSRTSGKAPKKRRWQDRGKPVSPGLPVDYALGNHKTLKVCLDITVSFLPSRDYFSLAFTCTNLRRMLMQGLLHTAFSEIAEREMVCPRGRVPTIGLTPWRLNCLLATCHYFDHPEKVWTTVNEKRVSSPGFTRIFKHMQETGFIGKDLLAGYLQNPSHPGGIPTFSTCVSVVGKAAEHGTANHKHDACFLLANLFSRNNHPLHRWFASDVTRQSGHFGVQVLEGWQNPFPLVTALRIYPDNNLFKEKMILRLLKDFSLEAPLVSLMRGLTQQFIRRQDADALTRAEGLLGKAQALVGSTLPPDVLIHLIEAYDTLYHRMFAHLSDQDRAKNAEFQKRKRQVSEWLYQELDLRGDRVIDCDVLGKASEKWLNAGEKLTYWRRFTEHLEKLLKRLGTQIQTNDLEKVAVTYLVATDQLIKANIDAVRYFRRGAELYETYMQRCGTQLDTSTFEGILVVLTDESACLFNYRTPERTEYFSIIASLAKRTLQNFEGLATLLDTKPEKEKHRERAAEFRTWIHRYTTPEELSGEITPSLTPQGPQN